MAQPSGESTSQLPWTSWGCRQWKLNVDLDPAFLVGMMETGRVLIRMGELVDIQVCISQMEFIE